MENQPSYVVNNVTIFVEGVGFVGNCSYQAPELKFKEVECGGAAGTYKRKYGAVEALESSAKVTVTNQVLYKALAKMDEAKITFASALETGGTATGRREVLQGGFNLKENESKDGEVYEAELSISPFYWLKEIGGKEMIEVDMKKNIVKIDGKDLLEETRKVVGG